MIKSEMTNELFTALSKAQKDIKGATKDSENPFFKSKYADLQAVVDACRDALAANGLCIVQTLSADANGVTLETILGHTSGQYITSSLPIRAKDNTPQAQGSAISYARRYSLAAIVGVYQTDDDAEGTTSHEKPAQRPAAKRDAALDKELPLDTEKQAVLLWPAVEALILEKNIDPNEVLAKMITNFQKDNYEALDTAEKIRLIKWDKAHK